jgi:hypothetical protein
MPQKPHEETSKRRSCKREQVDPYHRRHRHGLLAESSLKRSVYAVFSVRLVLTLHVGRNRQLCPSVMRRIVGRDSIIQFVTAAADVQFAKVG